MLTHFKSEKTHKPLKPFLYKNFDLKNTSHMSFQNMLNTSANSQNIQNQTPYHSNISYNSVENKNRSDNENLTKEKVDTNLNHEKNSLESGLKKIAKDNHSTNKVSDNSKINSNNDEQKKVKNDKNNNDNQITKKTDLSDKSEKIEDPEKWENKKNNLKTHKNIEINENNSSIRNSLKALAIARENIQTSKDKINISKNTIHSHSLEKNIKTNQKIALNTAQSSKNFIQKSGIQENQIENKDLNFNELDQKTLKNIKKKLSSETESKIEKTPHLKEIDILKKTKENLEKSKIVKKNVSRETIVPKAENTQQTTNSIVNKLSAKQNNESNLNLSVNNQKTASFSNSGSEAQSDSSSNPSDQSGGLNSAMKSEIKNNPTLRFMDKLNMENLRAQVNDKVQSLLNRSRVLIKDTKNASLDAQLYPKEMGKISLKLNLIDGNLQGKFLVDNEIIQRELNNRLNQIANELKDMGFEISSFEVNVRSSGNGKDDYPSEKFPEYSASSKAYSNNQSRIKKAGIESVEEGIYA